MDGQLVVVGAPAPAAAVLENEDRALEPVVEPARLAPAHAAQAPTSPAPSVAGEPAPSTAPTPVELVPAPSASEPAARDDDAPGTRAGRAERRGLLPQTPYLGRLRRVGDLDEVWSDAATDVAPWLAENVDVLGEAIGETLTTVATDVAVGPFRVDLQARNATGDVVLVVTRLSGPGVDHLGQSLVCAAGLGATTVVWVCRGLCDEMHQALAWLNARTDDGLRFFGVELGLVQVGEGGPRAPVLDVVTAPAGWTGTLRPSRGSTSGATPATGGAATPDPGGEESPENRARQDLFAEVLEAVSAIRPDIAAPARHTGRAWVAFADGPFGRWALAQDDLGRVCIEARIDTGDLGRSAGLFDLLEAKRETWDAAVGTELDYVPLDGHGPARIVAHHPAVDLLSVSSAEADLLVVWLVQRFVVLYDALDGMLRARATLLQDASRSRR